MADQPDIMPPRMDAEAVQAIRDRALVEAAGRLHQLGYDDVFGTIILTLRDNPAPGVTVQDAGFCPSNDLISISEEEL